jgi:hypothetical protein
MRGLLCVAIALTAGCAQPKEAKVGQVTLADLERETASLVYFNFVGSDGAFDYYTTPAGRRFKVAAAESKMHFRSPPPQMRPPVRPGDGIALFVKLKDGRWVPPDPEKMRALFPDAGAESE